MTYSFDGSGSSDTFAMSGKLVVVRASEPFKKKNAHKHEPGVYSQLFHALYDP